MQGRDASQHSSHVGAAPESKMAPPSPDFVKKALPSHLSDGDHVPYACTSLRMLLLVGVTVRDVPADMMQQQRSLGLPISCRPILHSSPISPERFLF